MRKRWAWAAALLAACLAAGCWGGSGDKGQYKDKDKPKAGDTTQASARP
jgi:hypothetical protein